MEEIVKRLFALQDLEYRDFSSKLTPNVNKDYFIGVRLPQIRELAKEIYKNGGYEEFLSELPHKYHEENFLHAFILERLKDFNKLIKYLDKFLPFIDNWSVCDTCKPKVFAKHKKELLPIIKRWLKDKNIYTQRYAIGMLMSLYLDEDFKEEYLSLVAAINSDEYYLKMMVAWYFATALAKQYDSAVKVLENKILAPWVHNKTIQKAKESFRVSDEHKEYISRLIIKK